ncbi:MAG TPA: hypothetical protein VM093_07685 [Aeromicrobium sp.]|nr:hypothetical protein [Aeromicrobium sp.]
MNARRAAIAIVAVLVASACAPTRTSDPTRSVISYRDGVELRNAGDVGKLKGAPADFQQYIAGAADVVGGEGDPDDKCSPRIFVDKVDASGFARGGIFDCGGAQLMWARRGGGIWRQIWGGQITPDCPTMTKYRVPASIAGKTCWDVKAQEDVPYRP